MRWKQQKSYSKWCTYDRPVCSPEYSSTDTQDRKWKVEMINWIIEEVAWRRWPGAKLETRCWIRAECLRRSRDWRRCWRGPREGPASSYQPCVLRLIWVGWEARGGPLLCSVIQDCTLWHAADLYQCGKRLQSPCVHVWLHGCLFGLCVVSATKAIKWAEPCVHYYAVCMQGV